MNDASALISPIDVAVCDPDVLWRVEHMNAIKGVNVREFASAADAVEAATPGHWMVVVIGPSAPRDELAAVAASETSTAWMRLVVVDRNEGEDLGPQPGGLVVDLVLGVHTEDEEFAAAVLEQFARQDEAPDSEAVEATGAGANEAAAAPGESSPEGDAPTDAGVEPVAGAGAVALPVDGQSGDRLRTGSDVIIVTSAKGGEGASTIALNLAIEIASPSVRVALIDGDPHFGDLALDLGLKPAMAHGGGKDATADHGRAALMSKDLSGVMLVQLPPPTDTPGAGSPEDARRTLEEVIALAREQADVIVVDLPIDTLLDSEAFHDLGPILVVTTGHTASVKNAMLAADQLGVTRDAGLVVNEISHVHSSVAADEIARSVGLPLRAHLPYDSSLVRAATTPEARLVAGRHSRYGRAIRALRHDLAVGAAVTTG